VDAAQSALRELDGRYHAALKTYDGGNPESYKLLDRQVKGLAAVTPGRRTQDDPPPDPWDGLFQLAMTVAGPQHERPPTAGRVRR